MAPGKVERVRAGHLVCIRPQCCPYRLCDLEIFPDLSVPSFPTVTEDCCAWHTGGPRPEEKASLPKEPLLLHAQSKRHVPHIAELILDQQGKGNPAAPPVPA